MASSTHCKEVTMVESKEFDEECVDCEVSEPLIKPDCSPSCNVTITDWVSTQEEEALIDAESNSAHCTLTDQDKALPYITAARETVHRERNCMLRQKDFHKVVEEELPAVVNIDPDQKMVADHQKHHSRNLCANPKAITMESELPDQNREKTAKDVPQDVELMIDKQWQRVNLSPVVKGGSRQEAVNCHGDDDTVVEVDDSEGRAQNELKNSRGRQGAEGADSMNSSFPHERQLSADVHEGKDCSVVIEHSENVKNPDLHEQRKDSDYPMMVAEPKNVKNSSSTSLTIEPSTSSPTSHTDKADTTSDSCHSSDSGNTAQSSSPSDNTTTDSDEIHFFVGRDLQLMIGQRSELTELSPVFNAMFQGPLQESGGAISVPDVEPWAFAVILRFAAAKCETYCDPGLTEDGVWEILKVSDKYDVRPLTDMCFRYLLHQHPRRRRSHHLCYVLELAHHLNYAQQHSNVLAKIKKNAAQVLKNPDALAELCQQCMLHIVASDDLKGVDEIIVHDAVLTWTHNACVTQGRDATNLEELRGVAGDLVKHVRYLTIPKHTLAGFRVGDPSSCLLTSNEMKTLLNGDTSMFPNSVKLKRSTKKQNAKKRKKGKKQKEEPVTSKCIMQFVFLVLFVILVLFLLIYIPVYLALNGDPDFMISNSVKGSTPVRGASSGGLQ